MLDGCKTTQCSYPRRKCVDAFPSVLELKFHFQDVHCIELTKSIKRRRSTNGLTTMSPRRKRSRKSEDRSPDVKVDMWPQLTYEFVNETTTLCNRRSPGTSTPPSTSSHGSSPSNTATDENMGAAETPASFVCIDLVDEFDPRLFDE